MADAGMANRGEKWGIPVERSGERATGRSGAGRSGESTAPMHARPNPALRRAEPRIHSGGVAPGPAVQLEGGANGRRTTPVRPHRIAPIRSRERFRLVIALHRDDEAETLAGGPDPHQGADKRTRRKWSAAPPRARRDRGGRSPISLTAQRKSRRPSGRRLHRALRTQGKRRRKRSSMRATKDCPDARAPPALRPRPDRERTEPSSSTVPRGPLAEGPDHSA